MTDDWRAEWCNCGLCVMRRRETLSRWQRAWLSFRRGLWS